MHCIRLVITFASLEGGEYDCLGLGRIEFIKMLFFWKTCMCSKDTVDAFLTVPICDTHEKLTVGRSVGRLVSRIM